MIALRCHCGNEARYAGYDGQLVCSLHAMQLDAAYCQTVKISDVPELAAQRDEIVAELTEALERLEGALQSTVWRYWRGLGRIS